MEDDFDQGIDKEEFCKLTVHVKLSLTVNNSLFFSFSLSLPLPPSLQTYTADPRLEWIDVREWVIESYPWQPSINVNKLQTLSPEDVSWNHGKLAAGPN